MREGVSYFPIFIEVRSSHTAYRGHILLIITSVPEFQLNRSQNQPKVPMMFKNEKKNPTTDFS